LNYFDGLVPHLVEDGLSILRYTDDTILFLDDLEKAKNLKLVLCAFEKLSGLKINFHKSELFCFGEQMKGRQSMWNFLVVKKECYPSDICEFQ
jgi:hypothetical protein